MANQLEREITRLLNLKNYKGMESNELELIARRNIEIREFKKNPLFDIETFKDLGHGVVGATIQFQDGPVRIYSVHLHHLYAKTRMEVFAEINKDVERYAKNGRVIIGGDFNSRTESDGELGDESSDYRFLGEAGYDFIEAVKEQGYFDAFLLKHEADFESFMASGSVHTYPAGLYANRVRDESGKISQREVDSEFKKEPWQRIDYFWVPAAMIDKIEEVEKLKEELSDHYAIRCRVRLLDISAT